MPEQNTNRMVQLMYMVVIGAIIITGLTYFIAGGTKDDGTKDPSIREQFQERIENRRRDM